MIVVNTDGDYLEVSASQMVVITCNRESFTVMHFARPDLKLEINYREIPENPEVDFVIPGVGLLQIGYRSLVGGSLLINIRECTVMGDYIEKEQTVKLAFFPQIKSDLDKKEY